MSKRRRIEITILRRRTTITRYEKLVQSVPPLLPHDSQLPLPTKPPLLVEAELVNDPPAEQSASGQSAFAGKCQDQKVKEI